MAGDPITLWKNDGTSTSRNWQVSTALPSAETLGWTRDGYSFVNWNTAADGSGTSYEVGVLAPSGVGNHFAQWAADSTDYIATSTDLTSVANAIRTKAGLSVTLEFPSDFVTAIANIPTGITPTGTKQISFTQNGTTTEDVTNYASAQIAVNVPAGITPTGTINITENGTVDVTNYASANVNVSGGGASVVEEKDVNFYDYDGTLVSSYTAADFANLSALPANPSHNGLTAQGWNWTLSDAKTYVASCGKLNIGQMYTTDDGKTRIYIHLDKGRLSPMLGLGVSGSVVVDWGDNSETTTLTGNSTTFAKWTSTHNYPAAGDYVITLTVTTGRVGLLGTNNTTSGCYSLAFSSSVDVRNEAYKNSILKVEIGQGVIVQRYAFYYCRSLQTITIPRGAFGDWRSTFYHCLSLQHINVPDDTIPDMGYTFYNCRSLRSVSLPKTVTSLTNTFEGCDVLGSIAIPSGATTLGSTCRSCSALKWAVIPSGITTMGTNNFYYGYILRSIKISNGPTTLGNYAFYYCQSLTTIEIPESVTSLGTSAFQSCGGLAEVHFKSSQPPTSSSGTWTGVPTDCKIYVPTGALSAYTSADNYPSSSTYTYIEE